MNFDVRGGRGGVRGKVKGEMKRGSVTSRCSSYVSGTPVPKKRVRIYAQDLITDRVLSSNNL